MLTWTQKALPQFKDFEGEALSYVENWILCKSAEWLPDLTIYTCHVHRKFNNRLFYLVQSKNNVTALRNNY